jgi:hypothetical protein
MGLAGLRSVLDAAPAIRTGVYVLAVGLMTGVSAVVVLVFRLFFDRRDIFSLGLIRPTWKRLVSPLSGLVLGLALGAAPAARLIASDAYRLAGFNPSLLPIATLGFFAVAAFHEELVFRGYLLQNLIEARRPWPGVIVSALLFCAIHAVNPHFMEGPLGALTILLAGVALAEAYLLSGDLWFPAALHLGWNAIQGAILGLPVSGFPVEGFLEVERVEEAAGGNGFGPEGSPVGVAAAGAMVVLLAVLLWRRGPSERFRPGRAEEAGSRSDDQPT